MTGQALYRAFDGSGDLLYVGITADTAGRWSSHARGKPWWSEVRNLSVEVYADRDEAIAAELEAIAKEKPRYNIAGVSTTEMDTRREELSRLGKSYVQARTRLGESREALASAVRDATAAGVSEVEAATLAGVTRMTVRAWLGKDK